MYIHVYMYICNSYTFHTTKHSECTKQSIKSILVLRVCVRVSIISEISETGGRSATPLAPAWRTSTGELQRLLFESTRHMVGEKKHLQRFRR